MWITQPGTWTEKEETGHKLGSVSSHVPAFSSSGVTLFQVKADTSAKPASDKEQCEADQLVIASYEFKRVWTGAGARTQEGFAFSITYTPDWNLDVKGGESGSATAAGTIEVVVRSGGKDKKTYPTAISQPISAPPDQKEPQVPRQATALTVMSPTFPHIADLDLEVQGRVSAKSEAAGTGASATTVTLVSDCTVS